MGVLLTETCSCLRLYGSTFRKIFDRDLHKLIWPWSWTSLGTLRSLYVVVAVQKHEWILSTTLFGHNGSAELLQISVPFLLCQIIGSNCFTVSHSHFVSRFVHISYRMDQIKRLKIILKIQWKGIASNKKGIHPSLIPSASKNMKMDLKL